MTGEDSAYPLRIWLDYTLSGGWYKQYLDGLVRGNAVAARCEGCGRTTFPPNRTCMCGARSDAWTELSGIGTIIAVTQGVSAMPLREGVRTRAFALVAMDGADNLTFGRLAERHPILGAGTRVRLVKTPEPPKFPTQAVCFAVADAAADTRIDNGN